ncbi:hypothetical protein BASA81_002603 [Batrachochytrium salamandrivorans]|nr:hypothetical protein BASA81_002603 [Batrachochytrium salamandrivorans]
MKVRELTQRFSQRQGGVSSPAEFDLGSRAARLRELEQIRLARKLASQYNATLRALRFKAATSSTKAISEEDRVEEEGEDEELVSYSRRNSMEMGMEGEEEVQRGYAEIHRAVLLNKPSVSDLLLSARLNHQPRMSLTSVGPVELNNTNPNRLLPGVSVEQILTTFYATYSPDKSRDVQIVLDRFQYRTEALLFALECKYFVVITPEGLIIPFDPSTAPISSNTTRQASDDEDDGFSNLTTDSIKGYELGNTGEQLANQVLHLGGESEFL